MIREPIKIDIDQIAETEGHHIEVEVSMDNVIEEDHVMSVTIEMTIEHFRNMQNYRGQNFRMRYRNDNFGRGRSRPID